MAKPLQKRAADHANQRPRSLRAAASAHNSRSPCGPRAPLSLALFRCAGLFSPLRRLSTSEER
eukprot:2292117-Rhodomonas_salina.1